MKKFEYKSVEFDTNGFFSGGKLDSKEFDRTLNDLGREGWELVSCVATSYARGETRWVYAVFKREVGS